MVLNRSLYTWLASVIGIIIILYGVAYVLHQPLALVPQNSTELVTAPLVQVSLAAVVSISSSISIPSIGLNTQIEEVGLTSSGAVDVPKNPVDVAWYDKSPIPGEVGNSIIDGHYGWKNNLPVAFDHLSSLQKGDMIYVKNDVGSTTVFMVTKSVLYDENNNDPSIFISADGKAHLNLITCGGIWNKVKKSYSDRLVVFTDLQ